MHDRSSLFRLPAEGIVRATNPAPTLDPSFAVGREDGGEVSRFRRASLRAGVARLLARSVYTVEQAADTLDLAPGRLRQMLRAGEPRDH